MVKLSLDINGGICVNLKIHKSLNPFPPKLVKAFFIGIIYAHYALSGKCKLTKKDIAIN
jgi:hypothetical protein